MTRILASYFAASVLVCASVPSYAQTIKLGTLAPEGSPWHQVIRDIGESWREISGGTVEVRIYAGGVAGDESDMVRKMRVGQLHAAALTGEGLARIAQEVQALQMPMMFRSDAELNYVRDKLGSRLEEIFEERGFVLLAWGDAGWVHFFAQQPVVHPDDLKPMKLFTWAGHSAVVEAYKDQGYNPVPLASTDMMMALHSGLINAFPTTPVAALSLQWFGLAPHMTDLKWARLVGAVVVSKRAWERIPEDLRPRLHDAARQATDQLQARVGTLGREAVAAMQEHGLSVHAVPEETVPAWENVARAGYGRLIGAIVPADMVAEVERLRDEYRAAAAM
jgi:TRAP-type C4-dicarboxylate transport system substrate-binding protein